MTVVVPPPCQAPPARRGAASGGEDITNKINAPACMACTTTHYARTACTSRGGTMARHDVADIELMQTMNHHLRSRRPDTAHIRPSCHAQPGCCCPPTISPEGVWRPQDHFPCSPARLHHLHVAAMPTVSSPPPRPAGPDLTPGKTDRRDPPARQNNLHPTNASRKASINVIARSSFVGHLALRVGLQNPPIFSSKQPATSATRC